MYFFLAFVFFLFLFGSWIVTLFGFPGNWLIVLLSTLFYFFVLHNGLHAFGVSILFTLIGLALLGEILEFTASAMGIKKGGSKRGAFYAVIGSFIGGITGATLGPVGILFFAALGAMVGAVLGERSVGKNLTQSLQIGKAAFWGRIFGSLSKLLVGAIMVAIATIASFV